MNAWTNHFEALQHLIFGKGYNVQNMLEFGLGDGTLFYVAEGLRVTSVEVVAPNLPGREWFDKCYEKLSKNPLWDGYYVEVGEDVAAVEIGIRRDEHSCTRPWNGFDPEHPVLKQLGDAILPWTSQTWDLVLVDAGVHMRGEIANFIWPSTKILAIHDCDDAPNMYGWEITKHFAQEAKQLSYNSTRVWVKE